MLNSRLVIELHSFPKALERMFPFQLFFQLLDTTHFTGLMPPSTFSKPATRASLTLAWKISSLLRNNEIKLDPE